MRYLTQLEPSLLLDRFLACPPLGFEAARLPSGLPVFRTPFDLTTTMDDALRARIATLPLYRHWRHVLRRRTRFVGCTTTEYLPLPADADADALAEELLRAYAHDCAVMVVKDIAHASPLLDAHANAKAEAFLQALSKRGFIVVEGMSLAWVAMDFASMDEYLRRLSAARRKDIRRKLRARARIEIECVQTGDARFDDPAELARYYALYRNVYEQSQVHFDLLTPEFLAGLLHAEGNDGRVFVYRLDGEMIGWNLCYVYAGRLIDKYIGFAYPQARLHNLYFVSWAHNLEYALQCGLSHYVAGWTDPQIKRYLGAQLTRTRHAVYMRNPALRALLRKLPHWFDSEPS